MHKETTLEKAIAMIPDGASIMVGGFGSPGTPFTLIEELLRQGQKGLTLIKNDANEQGLGISKLVEAGQVKKLITTHIGLNKKIIQLMNDGSLQVSFFPQGILAEKIRTAGAGSFGFLTDIGLHSEITNAEDVIEWQCRTVKVESALYADFALVHAHQADHFGNLVYRATAMNFCPLMAMAAEKTIAETPNLVTPGTLVPETVHTPSAFLTAVVRIDADGTEYGLMEGRYES
ncbi:MULTISPECIES: CoA transferase subunit A [Kordiimonas]|mgnify:CR=1 FL=1|jgi:acetate CoA/acetoacetate CoA-transferase alpha subunit|uniref:CoA transferase subunit A n=1 Tax=Kordiimonas TaxID=288021 RepID=UPI00257DCC2B|nr:CoA transferase subunit A [Kordiimonas sp. UBA4487]